MKETQWISAIFSPTGATAKVARAVAQGAALPVREIDLSARTAAETLPADAVLLAAAPVYGGRIPPTALERLAALKGEGSPAVALVVYGNREYEDALLELKTALEKAGFRVVAAAAFIAEHSIVRSIAAGRPDEADLRCAADFGKGVAEKLARPEAEQAPVQVPGNPEYKIFKGMPFHPKADKHCVKCGKCAAECPVGAIPPEAPNLTNEQICINCMRCIAVCPEQARAMPAPAMLALKGMLLKMAGKPKQPETFV